METNSINSFLVLITGDIDSFMYTYILVALLVFTGIYFTIRTKGVQFRYIKDMFTQLFEKKVDKNGKAISSFQAMMVSTGSRVGTGNIAGIATALAMGGPGALFWMWVMALIGGASAFIESTLAQIFKIRGKDGQFRGGPAYYIQQGLGKRWMGIVFAVSLIACYVVGFNELQAYNAASGLEYYIPDYATNGAAVVLGVVFTIATAAVIFGGQKRISVINSWVVPIMALAYIGLGVWITFSHLNLLPAAFGMMFASAFRLSGDIRWVCGVCFDAGHQAWSVLQRSWYGLGTECSSNEPRSLIPRSKAWCRRFRSISIRSSSARVRP